MKRVSAVALIMYPNGWNLIADSYILAWMFSDGVGREIRAVSCKDHTYDSVGEYDYAGSDMMDQDYEAGNDVARKIGMSGVNHSLDQPYFAEDQNVTLIAAYHSESLPLTYAEITSLKNGEKYGKFYIDNVDPADSSAAANFVKTYNKAKDEVEKEREDAKENSLVNNIDNTLFYAGDMKNILTKDFIDRHGRPDVIVTDPPRAGMHSDVVKVIIEALPKKIVYVSCNPATQARDLNLLDNYYKITAVQPVDMFPHTPHVENVVALERRNQLSIDNN